MGIHGLSKTGWLALLSCVAFAATTRAQLAPDRSMETVRLPSPANPHWIWVNDQVFPHMPDGRAHLIDGDTGRYLGALNTGYSFIRIVLPSDGKLIYSPETYFSRGIRGDRTDVVTLYDPASLDAVGEIAIPPKRASMVPMMGHAEITDNDRFVLVFNFTPVQSVSVVDARTRSFAGEVQIAGCALIYPSGPSSFFTICGDGALLSVQLDENGKVAGTTRTEPILPVTEDPVTEKAVRFGQQWLFMSFDGQVHPIDSVQGKLTAAKPWPLSTAQEREQQWRPGGMQYAAVHEASNRLFVVMHQGNAETYREPGEEVWVYDLRSHKRIDRFKLRAKTGAIEVTEDANPLLFSIAAEGSRLDVYEAKSGKHLRSVENIGTSPSLLVRVPVAGARSKP